MKRREEEQRVVSEKTGISLGLLLGLFSVLVAIGGGVLAAAWWGVSTAEELKLGQSEARAAAIQARRECVTRDQFNHWTYDLQNQNHALNIPLLTERGSSMQTEPVPKDH